MSHDLSRRDWLKAVSAGCAASVPFTAAEAAARRTVYDGWVRGHLTGAEALVETLIQEGTDWVYGIPGAQENELWDTFKSKRLGYLLCTHEFSAAAMADGCARATGKPGVLCIVPGPGLTNSLSGLGEALLDSVPLVCVVGDIGNGRHARPFQVHCLDTISLLRPVTKEVVSAQTVEQIPDAVRRAFLAAKSGEPGPAAVVIPYNLFLEAHRFNSPPLPQAAVPYDEAAARAAFRLLADRRLKVGIYAGMGCMDFQPALVRAAEILQAPVATSMCGKGAFPENHCLSVGWGYGPQGTQTAEEAFKRVDVVLAIGVKYSEVSTGFYSIPQHKHLIHVDINPNNLGRILRPEVCVNADAGVFLARLIDEAGCLVREPDRRFLGDLAQQKQNEARANAVVRSRTCVDPMAFLLCLRKWTRPDCQAFVDVTMSQYWATEVFSVTQPRTFFNPTDNQSMGWSIPASLGAQKIQPGRQIVTVTGDGCFLMSAMEISTASRECLPVKFFILDDHAYHYMQELQRPAYLRTTATILSRLDYRGLASGFGVHYNEITSTAGLEEGIQAALHHEGPVLTRVAIDYGNRPVRWLRAARGQYIQNMTLQQRTRFLARIGRRALDPTPDND